MLETLGIQREYQQVMLFMSPWGPTSRSLYMDFPEDEKHNKKTTVVLGPGTCPIGFDLKFHEGWKWWYVCSCHMVHVVPKLFFVFPQTM